MDKNEKDIWAGTALKYILDATNRFVYWPRKVEKAQEIEGGFVFKMSTEKWAYDRPSDFADVEMRRQFVENAESLYYRIRF